MRTRTLTGWWRALFVAFSAVALTIGVIEIFQITILGKALYAITYYYLLLALYLSLVFLFFPLRKKDFKKITWYDFVLFALTFSSAMYFALHGLDITLKGWSMDAPLTAQLVSLMLWLLVLLAVRRTQGNVLFAICLAFSFLPLVAGHLPGFLAGMTVPFMQTITYHVMGDESIIGIPLKTFGTTFIGFMVFAVALEDTGAGKFFINIALSLFGFMRGGAAKVSVVSSALFGTISGSVISNVLTCGSFTIPAMKKSGFDPVTAAAVETCASTGGVLMPPVMGTVAFVMANFLGVPYVNVAIAAAVPSILYYVALYVQIDGYAAKKGLSGFARQELPPLRTTLKDGWVFIFGIGTLLYFLGYLRNTEWAPFYATLIILVTASFRKETRLNWPRFVGFVEHSGKVLAELLSVLAAIGVITGSMALTGIGHGFARGITNLAGDNVWLLLGLGFITSFILGMGMTVTACYIFLAIVLAPALISAGLNPMASHLFIMYCGMLSYITPPVALGAFAAAGVANANPMLTGFRAVWLGSSLLLLPFAFALNPALILQGGPAAIATSILMAIVGVLVLASGLEGYLIGVGRLNAPLRILAILGGAVMLAPDWRFSLTGLSVTAVWVTVRYLAARGKRAVLPAA